MGKKQQNGQPSKTASSAGKRYSELLAEREKAVQLWSRTIQLLHPPDNRTIAGLQLKYGSGSLLYQEKLMGMTEYFDARWYSEQYPEIAGSGLTPAEHFLRIGWRSGWNPSPHFDTLMYLKRYPVITAIECNPLIHFLETGSRDVFLPCCLNLPPPEEDYVCLLDSPLFQADYYTAHLPSRTCAGKDPFCHFLTVGWQYHFDPSPDFSISQYLLANPDIQAAGINPLLHYIKKGIAEGRSCKSNNYELLKKSAFFDEKQYRDRYGKELGIYSPLEHYLLFGWKKGNLPSELFSDEHYVRIYQDLLRLGEPGLCHYLRAGIQEGRKPFPARLPSAEFHFPAGFDQEHFSKRQDKILIAVHQLDFSGVPVLAGKIAAIFSSEQKTAVISPLDGPFRQSCVDSGIPVIVDPSFFITAEGIENIRKNGFSICLFNTLCLAGVFLRCSIVIPSLLWIHENWTSDSLPQAVRDQLRNAPFVFTTSGITLKLVREYASNVRQLPYPVRDFGKAPKKRVPQFFRFALVAKLEERKGQDIAIRAFRLLPEKYRKNASLILIGDSISSDLPAELKKLAGNEAHIQFLDTIRQPDAYHAFYDRIEVLLCPSRTDPMPLVVFDAMMHGCPVILSDTVGQMSYIRNGKNGFVFKSEDEKALASRMKQIMDSADDYPKMSAAVRQTFLDHFTLDHAEKEIRKVFTELAELSR